MSPEGIPLKVFQKGVPDFATDVDSKPKIRALKNPDAGRSKRQSIEADIAAANAEEIPLVLQSEGFRSKWIEWQEYRSDLYRRDSQKRWSAQAARNTLAECS